MRIAAALVLAVVTTGCNVDARGLGTGGSSPGSTGPDPESSRSSESTVSTGFTEPPTTTAPESTGSSTDEGESPSTGSDGEPSGSSGEPDRLVDTELLARWYIDEADMGTAPVALNDDASNPLDLTMAYVRGAPQFAELEGHRGLTWGVSGHSGRARAPIERTKIEDALIPAHRFTIELVLAVDSLHGLTSRFFHIGTGGATDLAVGSSSLDVLEFRWGGNTVRTFMADLGADRQAIHVVIDTDQGTAEDRVLAYRNGSPLVLLNVGGGGPDQGADAPLQPTSFLTLGNRSDGQRSFGGHLNYAAIYTAALSPAEVMVNADVLGISDDSP